MKISIQNNPKSKNSGSLDKSAQNYLCVRAHGNVLSAKFPFFFFLKGRIESNFECHWNEKVSFHKPTLTTFKKVFLESQSHKIKMRLNGFRQIMVVLQLWKTNNVLPVMFSNSSRRFIWRNFLFLNFKILFLSCALHFFCISYFLNL